MSAMAAARLGYRCHILTPRAGQPGRAGLGRHARSPTTRTRRRSARFAAAVDVITFEFENVSAAGLDLLASLRPVRPSPDLLRISQDRVAEKSFLNATPAFRPRRGRRRRPRRTATRWRRLGLPAVLKTTRLGYDGKGQAVLREPADLAAGWERWSRSR